MNYNNFFFHWYLYFLSVLFYPFVLFMKPFSVEYVVETRPQWLLCNFHWLKFILNTFNQSQNFNFITVWSGLIGLLSLSFVCFCVDYCSWKKKWRRKKIVPNFNILSLTPIFWSIKFFINNFNKYIKFNI